MPFVQIGKAVHHYSVRGRRDKAALVFSNSLGTDLRIWDEVAAGLSEHFQLVLYDKRGHGLSDAPEPPYTAGDLAGDVVGLLDFLKIDQAVVCGISVGGIIAQAMALNHSRRVRSLILCDTGARIGTVDSWRQRVEMARAGGLQPLVQMTMERWFSKGYRGRYPADVHGYANMLLATNVEGYIGTCCALRDADFRGELSRLNHPTLVLAGAEDIATPPELGRELAGLISGARFSMIDGAGHLPCIERPGAVVEQMMRFFREVQIV